MTGLGRDSGQGDLQIIDVLARVGCDCRVDECWVEVQRSPGAKLRGGAEFDLGDMPDAAPTVAVLALFCDGPTRITNIAHLEHKESRRLSVLAEQLQRLGAEVDMHRDGLTVRPPEFVRPAELNPCGDHRLAMALSLAGLAAEGIAIDHPSCVSKSFPEFFDTLSALGSASQLL